MKTASTEKSFHSRETEHHCFKVSNLPTNERRKFLYKYKKVYPRPIIQLRYAEISFYISLNSQIIL